MKNIYFSIIFFNFFAISSYCQQIDQKQLNTYIEYLKGKSLNDIQINKLVQKLTENPEIFNEIWKNIVDYSQKSDNKKWQFLNDLNVQFKTFQTTDNTTALGMTYDFNFDYAKFAQNGENRYSQSFNLIIKGNIAFNKNLNPNDFLETNVNYRWSHFFGGVKKNTDEEIFTKLNELDDKLVNISDMQSKEAQKILSEMDADLVFTNQYYYSFAPKFGLESNQDFSKKQFTPGLSIDIGIKGWRKNNTLSYCNIFDYPFAIIRMITGTDEKFTVYGSTFPTAQLNFDYILPTSDKVREDLLQNTDPFPRIKFETSFRTYLTRVQKENIFFNANYRYYKELNAPDPVVNAHLNLQSYFVMALQSTSGLFVSYSNGKLPFDSKTDEVYSLGFNYKLN